MARHACALLSLAAFLFASVAALDPGGDLRDLGKEFAFQAADAGDFSDRLPDAADGAPSQAPAEEEDGSAFDGAKAAEAAIGVGIAIPGSTRWTQPHGSFPLGLRPHSGFRPPQA